MADDLDVLRTIFDADPMPAKPDVQAWMKECVLAEAAQDPAVAPQPVTTHRARTRQRRSRRRWTVAAVAVAAAVALAVTVTGPGRHAPSGHPPAGTPRTATPPPTGSHPPVTHLNTRSISYVVGRVQAALDANNDSIFYEQDHSVSVSGAVGLSGESWMTPGATAARTVDYDALTGQPEDATYAEKGWNYEVMVSYTTATTGTWIDQPFGITLAPCIYVWAGFSLEVAPEPPPTPADEPGPGIKPPIPVASATDASQLGAALHSLLTAGNLSVVGPGTINGENAIELQVATPANYQTATAISQEDQKTDVWVDATTYLPIESDTTWNVNSPYATKNGKNPVTPQTEDETRSVYQWLPATPANLAQVTRAATVPAGFTQDILVPATNNPPGVHGHIEVPAPTTTAPTTVAPTTVAPTTTGPASTSPASTSTTSTTTPAPTFPATSTAPTTGTTSTVPAGQ